MREAEALQGSTDWGPTASAYKQAHGPLARRRSRGPQGGRRAVGPVPGAQDAFFEARHAAQAEQDAEFGANLQVKEALLVEAEALLPVRDLAAAKRALRDVQDRWEAAGKVPRGDLDRVERRMRAVEQAIRDAEDNRWRRLEPGGASAGAERGRPGSSRPSRRSRTTWRAPASSSGPSGSRTPRRRSRPVASG
ncbi:hypothetical protein GCM10025868_04280 [Angustibacter aerolatus]|uniref:DUF349 domain-containing protein n=1 Tax=Angustibacter aerolatus TaxID=1162965 RepID=A0ABQ6JAI6_9ACTN|nr:hypothetical protein GCM10025868_04280 [Angustibacter aerolatus]